MNSLPLYTTRGHSHLPRVNGLHYGFLLSLELKRVLPIRLNAKKKVGRLGSLNCESSSVTLLGTTPTTLGTTPTMLGITPSTLGRWMCPLVV